MYLPTNYLPASNIASICRRKFSFNIESPVISAYSFTLVSF